MKALVASTAIAATLLAATAAQAKAPPAGFRESPKLEPVASFIAGRPAQVWCATSSEAWQAAVTKAFPGSTTFVDAFSWPYEAMTFYRPDICDVFEQWDPSTRPVGKTRFAFDVFAGNLITFVHESIHAGGFVDELQTQCRAKRKIAEVAIRFFGFKPRTDRIRQLIRSAYLSSSTTPSAC